MRNRIILFYTNNSQHIIGVEKMTRNKTFSRIFCKTKSNLFNLIFFVFVFINKFCKSQIFFKALLLV